MRGLVIDTALGGLSVALFEHGTILASRHELMARGHQERLGELVRDVAAEAGGFDGLGRITVTVGPGSFTGLRVGLAFALGLGAALDRPVLGITTLAALAGSVDDLMEAYRWLLDSSEAKSFESVAIDSISEVAEVVLNAEKKSSKDPRQAYGAMQEQIADIIRAFRDLPERHVFMIAKLDKSQDEMGKMLYAPSMPGNKTGQALPYFFDEVLALRVERDADGNSYRALLCDGDGSWLAKDRSGKLDQWEAPDLGEIINKIRGAK